VNAVTQWLSRAQVNFNIRGNEWNGKYFVNLNVQFRPSPQV